MSTTTSIFSFVKPADHESGYTAALNANWDSLDALIADRAKLSAANTFAAAQTLNSTILLKGNVYYDSATAGIQADHSVGSTCIINWRAKGASNSKMLMRMMPNGTGESATTGDRTELTWMYDELGTANTGWQDLKVRHRVSDNVRFFHMLTDRTGSGQQTDRFVIEFDPNHIVSANEFSIVRDDWYDAVDAGSSGSWMFRIQEGTGITRIESNSIYLAAGNLVLGAVAGDIVIHTSGAMRPWGSASDKLGASGFPWGELWLGSFIDMTEIATPSAPAANGGRLFLKDNGSGKTQLGIIFNTGVAIILATQV